MRSPGRSRFRTWTGALVAAPVVLVLVGCTSASGPGALPAATSAPAGPVAATLPEPARAPGPAVTTNARDSMPAADSLTISSPHGRLSSVLVAGPYGSVQGKLNAAGTQWTSSAERTPLVSYHLTATATDSAGGTTTLDRTFSTAAAPRTLSADVEPYGGQQVGIGQPITVRLSAPVTGKANRAAVERALVVSASNEIGPASWSWISSTQLHFRPKNFWPAHTSVQVGVNLAGVHAGPGLWGAKNRAVSFEVGRSFVMRITNSKHMMTVTVDGKLVRSVPVSMGRYGFETRSGIKTIMSHEPSVRMSSASYGGKDFYDETVYYAQRLTWSGEYIHSAPWSVGSQGHANVSHGCVNVSPGNAIWLFHQTLVGDPVITTGTSRQMEPGNGTGGDWDVSWANWVAGSALG